MNQMELYLRSDGSYLFIDESRAIRLMYSLIDEEVYIEAYVNGLYFINDQRTTVPLDILNIHQDLFKEVTDGTETTSESVMSSIESYIDGLYALQPVTNIPDIFE